jgi:hypothetical protein
MAGLDPARGVSLRQNAPCKHCCAQIHPRPADQEVSWLTMPGQLPGLSALLAHVLGWASECLWGPTEGTQVGRLLRVSPIRRRCAMSFSVASCSRHPTRPAQFQLTGRASCGSPATHEDGLRLAHCQPFCPCLASLVTVSGNGSVATPLGAPWGPPQLDSACGLGAGRGACSCMQ